MIGALFGIGGIACIVVFAELLRMAKIIRKAEVLRKFVHILSGTFAATWAFFMPFWVIQMIAVLLLAVVLASRYLSIFKSVHEIKRLTYGEFLFPAGIFVSAALTSSEWVYFAAVLHMGLADGLAAAVGSRHSKGLKYKVMGQAKSLAGSGVFYILSFGITAAVFLFEPAFARDVSLMALIWLPVVATVLESVSVYGTDNLFVPLLVVVAMNAVYAAG